jgi:hypothetical protein
MSQAPSRLTLLKLSAALAVLGLVAALTTTPVGFRGSRQGRRIINDARKLDAAIDQWSLENGRSNAVPRATVDWGGF